MARPEKWDDKYLHLAEVACRLGATDKEVADLLDVSVRTISYWRVKRPEFAAALRAGKEEADARVERSLFHKAVGYEQEAVKIFMPAGAAEPVYAPYTERVAPDTTAAIFWLKNRRPDLWRDRSQIEHTGKDGGPIESVELTADEIRERLKERGLPTRIFDQ